MDFPSNEIIYGVRWLSLARHSDVRGTLTVFEPDDLPFEMRRYFLIESGPGLVRGDHASNAHELITAFRGSVVCDLDNGSARVSVQIEPGGGGLWVRPGVWLRLHSFSPETILGVAASKRYADVKYWATPRPALIGIAA